MIIAVDFDGTICRNNEPNLALINRLRAEQQAGNIVILWTCRCGNRLIEALNYMRRYGLIPNYVNENAPQAIRQLGQNSRKIYADVYIDDKAVRIC